MSSSVIVVTQEHPWLVMGEKNWKGASGFSIERWNFWKKRFGEIKRYDQASEKTKEVAAEAEGAMNRIESEAADR